MWEEGPLCYVPVVGSAIPCGAWFGSRPVVPSVIPDARGSDERPLCRRDSVPVWSAHAGGNQNAGDRSAEHAHAADRFAREIVGFLTVSAVRSRRLMGIPFGVRCT